MGEYKAVVWLVGLRHAKKGSIIAEALEIIGPEISELEQAIIRIQFPESPIVRKTVL